MYKVFINEKKIVLSSEPQDSPKTLNYDGTHSFELAIDLLTNTPSQGLNIYHHDIDQIWADLKVFSEIFSLAEIALTSSSVIKT